MLECRRAAPDPPTARGPLPDVARMVEGQRGLNWPRWQRLARAADDLRFAALFRSDHMVNAQPPDQDSLEAWVSLAWLASAVHSAGPPSGAGEP